MGYFVIDKENFPTMKSLGGSEVKKGQEKAEEKE